MLRFLKRWLGWEEDLDYFDPDDFKPEPRPRPVTARVLAGKSRKPPARFPKPAPRPQGLDDAEPLEADRSASWDRIGKNSR
jgi:hypothetical protein